MSSYQDNSSEPVKTLSIGQIEGILSRTDLIGVLGEANVLKEYGEDWRDWESDTLLITAVIHLRPADELSLRAAHEMVERIYPATDPLIFDGWGGYVDCTGNVPEFLWNCVQHDVMDPDGVYALEHEKLHSALFRRAYPGLAKDWVFD